MDNNIILKSTLWKFLERIGVFGTQFIVQIILARLLDPSDYGSLAIMTIFITISNVLIQNGFNTALIQRKDVQNKDYASILWVSLLIAFIVYAIIFFLSPFIAKVYDSPGLLWPLRVIALVLFPGAYNSVQLAKVSREMDFRKILYSNLTGTIIAGGVAIIIAYSGGGLWALVVQTVLHSIMGCAVMTITVNLKITFGIEWKRIRSFLSFGWKLVVSGILNTLSEQLNSLVIGIKYSASALGYYTRGMQFPQYGVSILEGTMSSVLLPALSKVQNNKIEAKRIMRNTMLLSSYLVFPLMAGLAAVSKNLVIILLTDKWLACVPYMQVFCFIFALYPVHVCNLQALNAMGRSDWFLKLEVIKKIYSITATVFMIILFDSPMAIAVCTLVISPVGWFVNSFPNRQFLDYGFTSQVKDLMPVILVSIILYGTVSVFNYFIGGGIVIFLQVITGILIYISLSYLLGIEQFFQIVKVLRNIFRRNQKGI